MPNKTEKFLFSQEEIERIERANHDRGRKEGYLEGIKEQGGGKKLGIEAKYIPKVYSSKDDLYHPDFEWAEDITIIKFSDDLSKGLCWALFVYKSGKIGVAPVNDLLITDRGILRERINA